MKIRISDIGPAGLKIDDTISLEALNKRLNDGSSSDIIFTAPPEVNLTVFSTVHGAETNGKIFARYNQPCSLCLKEIGRKLEVSGEYVFHRRPYNEAEGNVNEVDSYFDDIGINYFSGDHIELEELIQESLILALDRFWRPTRSCNGSCTVCSVNPEKLFNIKQEAPATKFASLLEDAGVKS